MKRRILALVLLTLLTPLVAGCAPTTPVVIEKEVVVEKEVVKEVPVEEPAIVTLRVSVAQMGAPFSDYELLEAVRRAADELSEEIGVRVEIPTGSFETRLMMADEPCESLMFTDVPDFDVYLLESSSALHAFHEYAFAPVPKDLFEEYLDDLYPPGRRAFSDAEGNLLGVPQATMPLMIIYNPEIMEEAGIDLPETITSREFVDIAREVPIAVPPHGGIGVAAAQSIIGEEFSEDVLRTADLFERISEAEEIVEELLQTGGTSSAGTIEIVELFISGEIAWTIHDSTFLALLAQHEYAGPVATTQLPIFNSPGGSAMGIGWTVPADSKNQELAWALIAKLVQDPAVIRWSLSNGMLPISESGFNQLVSDRLADGLLPGSLIDNDAGLSRLKKSVARSVLWRVPVIVPVELYNNEILPRGNDLIRQLAEREITLRELVGTWIDLLISLGVSTLSRP